MTPAACQAAASAYLMCRGSSKGLSSTSAVLKLSSMASQGSQLLSDSLQTGVSAIQEGGQSPGYSSSDTLQKVLSQPSKARQRRVGFRCL